MEETSFGRYRLQQLLGRGGMGEVWRAHDTETDRVVALKVLPAQWAEDEMFQQRFRREAHAAARINEPHVVPIHGYGEIDDRLYVEMRLIEGQDLHSVLRHGPLIPARAVAIIEQIAMALDAVHQCGMVHRDVKPSNILIARYDFAYLIDFGIARAANETNLTGAGHVVGTMQYMAPERFRNNDVDARADVYALACVLAECLTGAVPFPGEDAEQQLMAHLTAPPPRPSKLNSAVPAAFDAVIAKGMAKDPDLRYQNPLELSSAARAAVNGAVDAPGVFGDGLVVGSSSPAISPTLSATMPAEVTAGGSLTADAAADTAAADESSEFTGAGIDELLERAVSALSSTDSGFGGGSGDAAVQSEPSDGDADDLWPSQTGSGEIRRLTLVSADLIDSAHLGMQVEPETHRMLVRRYRDQVRQIARRYEGHLSSARGAGLLVVFGYPQAHEDDVYRAVQAGLDITREVAVLSKQAQRRFNTAIDVRVGVHRGAVYIDETFDDDYGVTGTLAAQLSALAPTGGVAVTASVQPLIREAFDTHIMPSARLRVADEVIGVFRVSGERTSSTETPQGPLVGRDHELSRLTKNWARARAGTLTAPAVVLRGEAGIGKSRLAAAATEIVRHDQGRIVELVGSPLHADVGLHPMRTLLERRCGIGRLTEPDERLQRLRAEIQAQGLDAEDDVALLAPVLGIDAQHGYTPVQAEGHKLQELIAAALTRYVLACFGGEPGLLLAEDAHWFDPSTLELLGVLLGRTDGRLLVVVTGREGGWLTEQWPAKVFDLLPLSDEECDELTLALNPAISPKDCAKVRARCGGVPFFVEQVVVGLGSTTTNSTGQVPDSLYEPLFARLLAIPNVVPVVAAAAIIGRHVDRDLLVAVVPLSEDEVDDVLDELEDVNILQPQSTNGWRFRHDLMREAAAELAPISMRRTLHAKIAEAMTNSAAGEPDWRQVAAHHEQAEQHAQAAAAYQKASTQARRRGALDEARTSLTHALTQLELCPPSYQRDRLEIGPRLQRWFLASAAEGYQSPAVTADVERCLQLIGGDLTEDQLFGTLFAVCSYYINKADLHRAAQLAAALRAAASDQWQWWSPAIECIHGMIAFFRGEYSEARSYFEKASVGFADEDQRDMDELWFIPHDAVALAYEHLAVYHVLHGDVAAAAANITRAMERADQLSFPSGPYNHVYAIDIDIWVQTEASQFDHASSLTADMIEKAQRYGFDFWQMFGQSVRSRVDADNLLRSGDADTDALLAQIDTVRQHTDFWRSVGLYAYQTHYDCIIGQLLSAVGRHDEARERLDAALTLSEETGMRFFDAEILRARARTHSDLTAKTADIDAAIKLAREQDAPLFEVRAALDAFEVDGRHARANLVDAVGRFASDCSLPEVVQARALLG
ncbi:MAG: cyclase [Mycobacterium sp.]|nr:MAG: cyclase [Mycobacterium sp.]